LTKNVNFNPEDGQSGKNGQYNIVPLLRKYLKNIKNLTPTPPESSFRWHLFVFRIWGADGQATENLIMSNEQV